MSSSVCPTGHIKDPVPLIEKSIGHPFPVVDHHRTEYDCMSSPWRWLQMPTGRKTSTQNKQKIFTMAERCALVLRPTTLAWFRGASFAYQSRTKSASGMKRSKMIKNNIELLSPSPWDIDLLFDRKLWPFCQLQVKDQNKAKETRVQDPI